MPPVALGLVLAAALVHAAWNLLAKQSDDPPAFLFLAAVAAALLGLPLAAWGVSTGRVSPVGLAVAVGSSVIHAVYFWLLSAGYRRGDLSVVYPVARGSSPALVALLAGPLLGESLVPLGSAGVASIVAGILLIAGGGIVRRGEVARAPAGLGLGLLVGLSSVAYSFVDRIGVTLVPPIVYVAIQVVGAALLMVPGWLRRPDLRARLAKAARGGAAGAALRRSRIRVALHRGWVRAGLAGGGVLVAYGLVLLAMTLAPVAYVVAGREVAIVFGMLLGAGVLGERVTPARAAGAIAVTAGVALLGFARA